MEQQNGNLCANNAVGPKGTKNMDIKNQFVKQTVHSSYAAVSHVESKKNEADGFINSLIQQKFEEFRPKINLQSLEYSVSVRIFPDGRL